MKTKLHFVMLVIVASFTINSYAEESFVVDNVRYAVIGSSSSVKFDQFQSNTIDSLIIPDTVTYNNITYRVVRIDDYACQNKQQLKYVVIGNNISTIGEWAFYNCPNLTSVTFPENLTSIEAYAFRSCPALKTAKIPNNVTLISGGAFYSCTSLDSVIIGSGVRTIGGSAFNGCSNLTYLVLGENVHSLEQHAISNCKKLSTIVSKSVVPPTLESSDFDYAGADLIVPCGTYTLYERANGWKYFRSFMESIFATLNIQSIDKMLGAVSIKQEPNCDNDGVAIIEASPTEGNAFVAWSDGNTENPRTLEVTQDTTLTATFAAGTLTGLAISPDTVIIHLKSASNLNGNLNCSKELEHYSS